MSYDYSDTDDYLTTIRLSAIQVRYIREAAADHSWRDRDNISFVVGCACAAIVEALDGDETDRVSPEPDEAIH